MDTAPVNILDLKPEEFKEFLDSFDHVFSDCDGVIWILEALPRVGEFFDLMKKHGKTVNFVSNSSLRSKEKYETRFKDAKIEKGYEHLTIPSIAIAEYLKSVNFNKKVFSISCPETNKVLKSYGIEYKEGPQIGPDYYEDFRQYAEDDPEIGAVVFDSDFQINIPKIHKAITYLRRPEVLFVCGATDKRIFFKKEVSTLGLGIFTDIVSEETKREPIALGKPGKKFGEFAMKRAGVTDPSRVLFIGDMIEQDVGLGKATGFKTLLLLTNVTKEEMLSNKTRPDFYAPSLESIVPLL